MMGYMVDRIIPPNDAYTLFIGTCDHFPIQSKSNSVVLIKVKDFEIGMLSWIIQVVII